MMTWKAVFLAAVLACTAGGGVDAAEMEKLKVAISFAGLWTSSQPIFCKDRGKFAEAGLDVDVVATRGGSENVQAVITRAVDIGYGAGLSAVLAAQMQGTDIKVIGSGFRLEHGGGSVDRPPAKLGEHTDEVLGEAGYSATDIAAMRADKVV